MNIEKYLELLAELYPFPNNELECIQLLDNSFDLYAKKNVEEDITYPIFTYPVNPSQSIKENIAVISYIDECGFLIREDLGSGFLGIGTYGKIDLRALTAQEVNIFGDIQYFGIIGNKPSHYLTEEDKVAPVDVAKLFVDTGLLKRNKTKQKIQIGDFAGYRARTRFLGNGMLTGHSLSTKVGSAAAFHLLQSLSQSITNISKSIHFIFVDKSARGMFELDHAMKKYNINTAILIDTVSKNNHPDEPNKILLGQGPAIHFGGSIDVNTTRKAQRLAEKYATPFQTKFYNFDEEGFAERVYTANGGCPCCLIGIPIDNIGMAQEICTISDIIHTSELLNKIVLDFEVEHAL